MIEIQVAWLNRIRDHAQTRCSTIQNYLRPKFPLLETSFLVEFEFVALKLLKVSGKFCMGSELQGHPAS